MVPEFPSPPFDLQRYGCAILTRKEKGGSSDPPFCIFACTVGAQAAGQERRAERTGST
jgi:hypothetical protein